MRHHHRQEPYAVMLHVRICAGAVGSYRPYRDQTGRQEESISDSYGAANVRLVFPQGVHVQPRLSRP
jgi:hypothetical protein